MNDEQQTLPAGETDLADVVEAYLAARETGRAVEKSELLAMYPEFADTLEACLESLEYIDGAKGGSVPEDDDSKSALGVLGDFRIRREIGRGGMGVVYEAEQLSLKRRVALKMLPFAAVLDPRHLQRFKNEAQAAGHLHHNHIVPVHAVGCERGVHYYAMQYIEGLSVAQVINELRVREGCGDGASADAVDAASSAALQAVTSGTGKRGTEFCRTVARLGIQAAEALDHAHVQGVVHRDIKPGNLLVDGSGDLWITDFGLASFSSRDTRSLTMTGDLLGTLRYMSPEQALASRVPIDHRTDTYSLGATLYEFLTLEPAMPGKDSQRILQEIAFKDPPPARRHNPAVPEDLETILIKAMAKAPADRYGTAQELADDLRRFLEHKPIAAKRPGLLKRAAKWCGRHRVLVGAAIALIVVAAVGLGVSTLLVQQAYHAESEQRARAEANFASAREAVDAMLTEVAARELADVPEAAQIRRRLLEKAQAFYESFLAEAGSTPELQLDAARAHARVGAIRLLLEDYTRAKASYEAALGLILPLVEQSPESPAYLAVAARAYRGLATATGFLSGETDAAERAFRDALSMGERLLRSSPDDVAHQEELAHCHNDLGAFLLQDDGRYAEAEEPLRNAADVYGSLRRTRGEPRHDHWLGGTQQNLAIALEGLGRPAEAEETYRRLLEVRTQLLNRFPERPDLRLGLAQAWSNVACLLAPPPLLPTALYSASQRQQEFPSAAEPPVPGATTVAQPADLQSFWAAPRAQRATRACEAARDLLRSLIEQFPEAGSYRSEYAKVSLNLAACRLESGDTSGALATMRDALQTAPGDHRLCAFLAHLLCSAKDVDARDVSEAARLADLGTEVSGHGWISWFAKAEVHYRSGEWPQALEALDQATERQHHSAAMIGFLRSMALHQSGRPAAARQAYADAERATDIGTPKFRVQWRDLHDEAAALLGVPSKRRR